MSDSADTVTPTAVHPDHKVADRKADEHGRIDQLHNHKAGGSPPTDEPRRLSGSGLSPAATRHAGSLTSLSPPSPHLGHLGQRRGSLKKAKEVKDLVDQASRLAAKAADVDNELFKAFLKKHKASEVKMATDSVIEVDGSWDAVKGFDTLLEHNILSAPCWDSETKQYVGFLDVRDLVSSIIHAHKKKTTKEQWMTESIVHSMSKFQNKGVPVSLTYLARRNPFRPVKTDASLFEVATILSGEAHRVPVLDSNGKCVKILSQSALLAYIDNHKDSLGGEAKLTLDKMGLGHKPVVSIPSTASALDAFMALDESGLSGIAVLDPTGKLIGNTSARDIKYFVLDRGQLKMNIPILDYLSQIRQREVTAADRHPSCSVRSSATLDKVIALLGATKYHRVFVVDDAGTPVGVASITDILKFATHEG